MWAEHRKAEVGDIVAGKYRVEARLGSGSVADVFRAEHQTLGSRFALKVLRLDRSEAANVAARFEREARALERLDHPNIVHVVELGQTERGAMFLAMELVEGFSLSEWTRRQPQSVTSACAVMTQILAALEHAHSRGVLHRDLKPENIMVTESVHGVHAKVVDFGIAKLVLQRDHGEAKLSIPGTVCGTPYNMAPEQVTGAEVDARSDVYAAGVLLYILLAGHPPFEGGALDVMKQHVFSNPPPIELAGADAATAAKIQAILERALAKEPAARFQTASEFRAAIEELRGRPQRSTSTPRGRPSSSPVAPVLVKKSFLEGIFAFFRGRSRRVGNC